MRPFIVPQERQEVTLLVGIVVLVRAGVAWSGAGTLAVALVSYLPAVAIAQLSQSPGILESRRKIIDCIRFHVWRIICDRYHHVRLESDLIKAAANLLTTDPDSPAG